jgi:glycosyltransferase involved in cell wall biosynthesis
MPRKNLEDAKQVLYILRYRKKLTGWTIREINNLPESQAAQILRESAIFMSFGHPEGFGLPPAEAMACQTIVIGYNGNGGAEYWPGHGIRIDMGDTLGYARALEQLLEEYDRDPTRLKAMARDAGRFVRDTYSPEAEKQSIVECWEKILASV